MEVSFTMLWFIENYSDCWSNTDGVLVSPVFTSPELEYTSWTLSLYPLNENDDDFRNNCLYLTRENEDKQTDTCVFLKRVGENGPDSLQLHHQISIFKRESITKCSKKTLFVNSKDCGVGWQFSILNRYRTSICEPSNTLIIQCQLSNSNVDREISTTLYARTRIGTEQFSFVHVVKNFSALEPNEMRLPQVHTCSKQEVVISSGLYMTDELFCSKQTLILHITPSSPIFILYRCTVYFQDSFGYFVKCPMNNIPLSVSRHGTQKISLSLTKDQISTMSEKYLSGDKLTLLCECTFYTGIEFNRIEELEEKYPTSIKRSENYLQIANAYAEEIVKCASVTDDLKETYLSEFLSDMEIRTQTKTFPAHKIILCARSPVLKQMFINDMVERKSNFIQIDDLKDANVQHLLNFLYTDKVENLQWDEAIELYYAADKYDLTKLKLMCSSFLVENLTASTAAEFLYLGYKHNDKKMVKIAVQFVLEHESEVLRSEKFEELVKVDTNFALKVIRMKYEKTDTEEEFFQAFFSSN